MLFFFPLKIKFPSMKIFRFLAIKIWNAKSYRENFLEITCVKKLLVYVKIFADLPRQNYNKTRLLRPWKWKSYPWKNHKKCPWKTQNVREKVCVKKKFRPWKKTQKEPKMAFTGTFDFHGGKKNTGSFYLYRHSL